MTARWLTIVLAICLNALSMSLHADSDTELEDKLKAAIVVKLSKFIEWPHEAKATSAPLSICLIGSTAIAAALAEMDGKTVHNRELKIVAFTSHLDRRLESCQIVFIGSSDNNHMDSLLNKTANRAIVTISDIPGFSQQGGMIEIVQIEEHLGFSINLNNAKKKGIALSAQLLSLAKIVE